MVSWDDPNIISSSEKFLKLKQGENKIRIVSEAGVFGKHWVNKKTTICIGKEDGCMGCEAGNESKPAWLCWVISRSDGKIKQMEIGYMIVKKINALAQTDEYKFSEIPPFDLTIIKSGEGLDTEYDVVASRKDTPLTDTEKAEIEGLTPIAEIIEKKKKIASDEPF